MPRVCDCGNAIQNCNLGKFKKFLILILRLCLKEVNKCFGKIKENFWILKKKLRNRKIWREFEGKFSQNFWKN